VWTNWLSQEILKIYWSWNRPYSQKRIWSSWIVLCGSPRLCRLRIEGLVPMSKYWTYQSHTGVYGPSKPSSLPSTEGGFTPIASMAALGEKLDTDPWISQPACCGLCREPFYSGAVALSIVVDDFTKRLSHTWTARRKRTRGVRGLVRVAYVSCWSSFPLQGVHRFESLWLSDMSNRLFVTAIK
jgi:hypothetical protein